MRMQALSPWATQQCLSVKAGSYHISNLLLGPEASSPRLTASFGPYQAQLWNLHCHFHYSCLTLLWEALLSEESRKPQPKTTVVEEVMSWVSRDPGSSFDSAVWPWEIVNPLWTLGSSSAFTVTGLIGRWLQALPAPVVHQCIKLSPRSWGHSQKYPPLPASQRALSWAWLGMHSPALFLLIQRGEVHCSWKESKI